jgi:hypothetical protein
VTGRIVASILTDRDVDDASQVEPLLDQIAEPVELFLGDGGYDRTGVYTVLDERHPDAMIVVPPRVDAVLSATADTEPTQRDCHIQAIAGKGRMTWQRDSGYNERSRAGSRSSVTGCVSTATRPAPPKSPSPPRSSTGCSTARTPSASPDHQRGMGAPSPLPPPRNTLPQEDSAGSRARTC